MPNWKPEIQTLGSDKYYSNSTCFATKEEAERAAEGIFNRWMLATNWRAVESDDPVNYRVKDGEVEPVQSEAVS